MNNFMVNVKKNQDVIMIIIKMILTRLHAIMVLIPHNPLLSCWGGTYITRKGE